MPALLLLPESDLKEPLRPVPWLAFLLPSLPVTSMFQGDETQQDSTVARRTLWRRVGPVLGVTEVQRAAEDLMLGP